MECYSSLTRGTIKGPQKFGGAKKTLRNSSKGVKKFSDL